MGKQQVRFSKDAGIVASCSRLETAAGHESLENLSFGQDVPKERGTSNVRPIHWQSFAQLMLDHATGPVALTAPDGRLLWAADDVRQTLRQHLLLAPCGNILTAPDEETQPVLERFLQSTEEGGHFLWRSDSGRDWIVIRKYLCEIAGRLARFLRFAFSSEEADCTRNGLAEFFRLTRTEVAVLDRYVRLYSPEDVAGEMGISRETVRSHLKQIRAKTGVHGGRELIRLVASFSQI